MKTTITIVPSGLGNKLDTAMLAAVLKRVQRDFVSGYVVTVYAGMRNNAGWLEWTIHARATGTGYEITLGAIQRNIGAEFEFCS